MLEMIVLGQIPGTQFQITIAWFTLAVFAGLLWVDHHAKHVLTPAKTTTRRSSAKSTRRKA